MKKNRQKIIDKDLKERIAIFQERIKNKSNKNKIEEYNKSFLLR